VALQVIDYQARVVELADTPDLGLVLSGFLVDSHGLEKNTISFGNIEPKPFLDRHN
jgi:hypothetical protein